MKRVQVIYEIGESIYTDEVAAEYVNVRVLPGQRVYVKTGTQDTFYCAGARVLIDHDYDGPAAPFTTKNVKDR